MRVWKGLNKADMAHLHNDAKVNTQIDFFNLRKSQAEFAKEVKTDEMCFDCARIERKLKEVK